VFFLLFSKIILLLFCIIIRGEAYTTGFLSGPNNDEAHNPYYLGRLLQDKIHSYAFIDHFMIPLFTEVV
jgi:hypothetical protein